MLSSGCVDVSLPLHCNAICLALFSVDGVSVASDRGRIDKVCISTTTRVLQVPSCPQRGRAGAGVGVGMLRTFQSILVSWFRGFSVSWLFGFKVSKFQSFKVPKIQRSQKTIQCFLLMMSVPH